MYNFNFSSNHVKKEKRGKINISNTFYFAQYTPNITTLSYD